MNNSKVQYFPQALHWRLMINEAIFFDAFRQNSFYIYMTPVCPQGYHAPRAFIAAQSPMEASLSDFWALIAEKKVQTVLLLCQLFEDSQVRNMHNNKNTSIILVSCMFVNACSLCVFKCMCVCMCVRACVHACVHELVCICMCVNVITLPCTLNEYVVCTWNVSSFTLFSRILATNSGQLQRMVH